MSAKDREDIKLVVPAASKSHKVAKNDKVEDVVRVVPRKDGSFWVEIQWKKRGNVRSPNTWYVLKDNLVLER